MVRFIDVLRDGGVDPTKVKLLRHTVKGKQILELWRADRAAVEAFQRRQKMTFFDGVTHAACFLVSRGGVEVFGGLDRVGGSTPAPRDDRGRVGDLLAASMVGLRLVGGHDSAPVRGGKGQHLAMRTAISRELVPQSSGRDGVTSDRGSNGLLDDLSGPRRLHCPFGYQEARPEQVVRDHPEELGGGQVDIRDHCRTGLGLTIEVSNHRLEVGHLPLGELRLRKLGKPR